MGFVVVDAGVAILISNQYKSRNIIYMVWRTKNQTDFGFIHTSNKKSINFQQKNLLFIM